MVLGSDCVYVLSVVDDRRTLHALDRETGERRWQVDLGSNSYVGNGVGAGLYAIDERVFFAGKPLAAYTSEGEELAFIPKQETPRVKVNVGINHAFIGTDWIVLEAGNAGRPEYLIGVSRDDYSVVWDRPSPMSWAFGRVGMVGNRLYLVGEHRSISGGDDSYSVNEQAESEGVVVGADRGGSVTARKWIPGPPVDVIRDTLYAEVSTTTETQGGIYGYPKWRR